MFTGLVQHMVEVKSSRPSPHGMRLILRACPWPDDATVGESICVNGCCLTVAAIERSEPAFDVVEQTLRNTTLGELRAGELVNVERALRADALVGGHFVQGHVDTTARILRVDREDGQWRTRIESPVGIDRYLHSRGSVSVDGVSLTIAQKGEGWFEVALIPETLSRTTLSRRMAGARVNVEADSMAKAVAAEVERHLQRMGLKTP